MKTGQTGATMKAIQMSIEKSCLNDENSFKEGESFMTKDYYGKCGSCIYCELGTAYTLAYSTSFKCSRNGYSVKADEKHCDRYEPAPGRCNDDIARYDR